MNITTEMEIYNAFLSFVFFHICNSCYFYLVYKNFSVYALIILRCKLETKNFAGNA